MKGTKFTLLAACTLFLFEARAQVINGSFETSSGDPSLAGWVSPQYQQSTSVADAPPGGGNWCLSNYSFDIYSSYINSIIYHVIPAATGQTLSLTGWARVDGNGNENTVTIGIGKINSNGEFAHIAFDTTSSTVWTQLSVQATLNLLPSDIPVIYVSPGSAGDGSDLAFAYFDLLTTRNLTSIKNIPGGDGFYANIYPNPANTTATIEIGDSGNAHYILVLYDPLGKEAKRIIFDNAISTIDCSELPPGVYFYSVTKPETGATVRGKLVIY